MLHLSGSSIEPFKTLEVRTFFLWGMHFAMAGHKEQLPAVPGHDRQQPTQQAVGEGTRVSLVRLGSSELLKLNKNDR